MKFYFCEGCGKRVTDQHVEDGLARDKKLKGVFCKDCAVGVMTVEFMALKDIPGHSPIPPVQSAPQSSTPASATAGRKGSAINIPAVQRSHSNRLAQQTAKTTRPVAIPIIAGACLAVIGIVFFILASGKSAERTAAIAKADAPRTTVPEPDPTRPPSIAPKEVAQPELPAKIRADETAVPPVLPLAPPKPAPVVETPAEATPPPPAPAPSPALPAAPVAPSLPTSQPPVEPAPPAKVIAPPPEAAPAPLATKPKPRAKAPHAAMPVVLASIKAPVDDIAILDQYAYCASAADGKVLVFDISDPKNLAAAGPGVATAFAGPCAVRLQGKNLYVLESSGHLEIFDVSKAPALTALGNVALSSGSPLTLDVQGNFAYVLQDGGGEVAVYDVSKPAAPVAKGKIRNEHKTADLHAQGRFVYTGGQFSNSGYMAVHDVSNPSAPIMAGSTGGWQYPNRLLVRDGIVFWPSGSNKLIVVNVANPARPTLTGAAGPGFLSPRAIAAQGNLLVAVDGQQNKGHDQLQLYDISTPASPRFVRTFELGHEGTRNMAAQDDFVFVVNGSSLISIDLGRVPLGK